jgi:hypothetical protein
MANAANNAALKAAMEAGGYKSINNMVSNYHIPANYKKRAVNMRNQKRAENMSYATKKEENKTLANLQFDRNVIKNLIRMGIKSAKPTKKERNNAEAERAHRAKAASVITKTFIKSKAPGAKKARERRVKEAAANYRKRLNVEKKTAESAARIRARAKELAENRARTGEVTTGRKMKVTGVVTAGHYRPVVAPVRAQVPVPSVPQRGERGAPGAFAGLSANARAAMSATVNRVVTAPTRSTIAAGGARSRILKALKKK